MPAKKTFTDHKIIPINQIENRVQCWKKKSQQLVFTKWYDKEQKRFLLTRRIGGEAAPDKPGAYETYDDHSSTYHGVVVEGLSPGMSFTWTSQWLSEDSKWIYTAQLQQDDKVQYTRIDTLQQIK